MKYLIIAAVSIIVIYLSYRTYRHMTLAEGLAQKISNGAIILDVRTEREFSTGHIKGAVNISLGTIRERFSELDRTKTYITTGSHGLRSVKAVSLLKEQGFKNVYNGGAWSDLERVMEQ